MVSRPLDTRVNMCLVKSKLPLIISSALMAKFLKRGENVTAQATTPFLVLCFLSEWLDLILFLFVVLSFCMILFVFLGGFK